MKKDKVKALSSPESVNVGPGGELTIFISRAKKHLTGEPRGQWELHVCRARQVFLVFLHFVICLQFSVFNFLNTADTHCQ